MRVASSGYEDFSRSVELTAGQTMMVAVTLAPGKPAISEQQTAPQTSAAALGPQSPLDIYKAMLGGTSDGNQDDPGSSRFYVTHKHGGVLGYGSGMCYGWLIIGKSRVQFSSSDEGDAFESAVSEISELKIKSNHIRFRIKNKKYHLMTQDMGIFGGDSQGPGALRDAFESVGFKAN